MFTCNTNITTRVSVQQVTEADWLTWARDSRYAAAATVCVTQFNGLVLCHICISLVECISSLHDCLSSSQRITACSRPVLRTRIRSALGCRRSSSTYTCTFYAPRERVVHFSPYIDWKENRLDCVLETASYIHLLKYTKITGTSF
jgi:hypothetical protein